AGQRFVFGKLIEHGPVGTVDVLGVAGQCGPAERPFALTEQRPDVLRYEAGNAEGVRLAALDRLGTEVVAVVERDRPARLQIEHRPDVDYHRRQRPADVLLRIAAAQGVQVFVARPLLRDVAVEGVVGRGL